MYRLPLVRKYRLPLVSAGNTWEQLKNGLAFAYDWLRTWRDILTNHKVLKTETKVIENYPKTKLLPC